MARVVVTGGAGKLGRACVADLARHGWDVVVFDRVPPVGLPDQVADAVTFVPVDLTDYGQVARGADGGRRPPPPGRRARAPRGDPRRPASRPNAATFANNMTATYNVFSAARRAGIRNIVWASSETVLGPAVRRAAAVPAGRRGVPGRGRRRRTRW